MQFIGLSARALQFLTSAVEISERIPSLVSSLILQSASQIHLSFFFESFFHSSESRIETPVAVLPVVVVASFADTSCIDTGIVCEGEKI